MNNIYGLAKHVYSLESVVEQVVRTLHYTQALIGDYKYSSRVADEIGWLVCDGRSISMEEYEDLYDVIGYSFGGSGSTFKLPDFRGRVPGIIGAGTALTNRTLGSVAGTETHTLTINEMPNHNHGGETGAAGFGTGVASPAVSLTTMSVADDGGSHTHTITTQGGNQPHNNMQPTLFGGSVLIFAKSTTLINT